MDERINSQTERYMAHIRTHTPHTYIHANRMADTQTDRQIDAQTDAQTDGQAWIQSYCETVR